MIKKIVSVLLFTALFLQADFYYSGGKKQLLTRSKTTKALTGDTIISYQTEQNETIGVSNQLLLSYRDIAVQKQIETKYNLTLVKIISDDIFLYQVQNAASTLEISNKIAEESGVKFAHPDFVKKKSQRALTHDPHSDIQWHLKDDLFRKNADVNIEQAWKYTKGKGVKVAVYDEGIDIDHKDLRENITAFANFNATAPLQTVPYVATDKGHGSSCLGILGAKENSTGGVGVSPEASLYAVHYASTVSKDIEAYEWLMRENVSVINNSWGTYTQLDAYNETFKKLATEGRGGKGIIIVFAAGNETRNLDAAGANDESESPYVLSVVATTEQNRLAEYSNYGSAVDFAAPGGTFSGATLFTVDATGEKGYSDDDYNHNFVGTSAAAPIVSGTVALMLSVNERLTREEVINILRQTADKLGHYAYDKAGHNTRWGYGKINAGRAVAMAKNYHQSNLRNFARSMYNVLSN